MSVQPAAPPHSQKEITMKRSAWHGLVALIVGLLVPVPCATLHAQPSVEGQWSGTIPFNNIEAIHTTLLPTGKVMFWQTWTDSPALWDPSTGLFSDVTSPSINIFCSGHAWLPDGRLLVVGGHIENSVGESVADIYDPFTDTWANSDSDPNNELFLAMVESRIVGVLQLTFIPYLTYQGGWRALIEGVRIASEFRSKGIGREMFQWAIDRARNRGCHMLQLTTDKARPDALRFYESLGFTASHEGLKLHLGAD